MAAPLNLTRKQIEAISLMIIHWKGKLTWGRVVEKVEQELGIKASRQALDGHFAIKHEFQIRKDALRGKPTGTRVKAPNIKLTDAMEKIERLERELAAEQRKNEALIYRLTCVTRNAARRRIDPRELFKDPTPVIKE